ncbi:MAG: MFS transporter [Acidobacteriota bacterium]
MSGDAAPAGPAAALNRRSIFAWALYDFGSSAFTTLVVTFIFSVYFTRRIATDPQHGTVLWTRAVNISAFVVAMVTPVLGAIADFTSRKKLFLLICTLQCSICTALLFFVSTGTTTRALILFVLANIAFEASSVFYNAFLPEISTRDNIGRISGMGWALGYSGGLLCLVVALGMIRGWLPQTNDLHIRSTNLLVALWVALFSIPFFLFIKEKPAERTGSIAALTVEGFRRIAATLGHLRTYREAAKLLLARLIYNDGLVTVFAFASIFAAAVFGLETDEIIIMGIAINVVAGIGAFSLGFLNDRIGGKRTIAITLIVLIIAAAIGATAANRTIFWVAAMILGFMVGPNQSASRSLLGLFIPQDKDAEFFGFFSFSGRLASIAGPFVYGTVLSSSGSQRWAMASIIPFFIVGLIVLSFVDEKKGMELVRQVPAQLQE